MKKLTLLFFYLTFVVKIAMPQQRAAITIKNQTSVSSEKNQAYCATDQLHSSLSKESSSYQKKFNDMNDSWQKWAIEKAKGNSNKVAGGSSPSTQSFQDEVLPVAFHRMINGVSSPITSSITNAQLQAALTILNNIYAGVASGSKPASTNTHIQFCMAQVDALGGATTTNSFVNTTALPLDNTNQSQINALSSIVQATGKFPTTKYINIYIVEDITSTVAGFAYMPPSHGSSFDGIYIEAQYLLPPTIPNDLSYNITVLSHEMGHYLGLFHTFGICNAPLIQTCSCYNNNCLFDGDMVCDTPPDFSQAATSGCAAVNTCTTDAAYTISAAPLLTADVNDLINNYMDYGDWNCQNSFTQGQINRMHFMIDEFIGPRNSLLHSSVCNAACVNTTCTVTINPITTTTVNGVYLPNTLILSGPTVSYNFTGNTCSPFYNTFNWSAINLATNTVFQTGTATSMNVTFSAMGNYRIIFKSSIAGSTPLCSQTSTLDLQILPPPVCSNNLDMGAGWNAGNWQRIQYEGGWARTTNMGSIFTFPTTTMTIVPFAAPNGVLNTDPTSMVSNLSADPNFSSIPMPAGITTAMRVGKLITSATTLPAGDASFVTYTFCPTAQNAKLKVYYLGMKEHDVVPVQGAYNFATNVSGGSASSFGFVCKYDFNGISGTGVATRGTIHSGASGFLYGKNDMMAGGIHTPTFTPIVIGGKNFDAMSGWQSSVLDFTEFICASPTITVTFFAKSDNAVTLGFNHSYSYFAAQCLPGNFKDIDLNLINKDIACANNVTQSCTSEALPVPSELAYYDNYNQNNYNYGDMFKLTIQESNDNITYTPTSIGYTNSYPTPYTAPLLTLCKNPDAFPYKYFRVTYQTLCQNIVDTMSIFQGFVHTLNDCAPNPMSGGHYINPPVPVGTQTLSPDQYVQYCGTTTITLAPPCWWHVGDPTPEYQWQYFSTNIYDYAPNYTGTNTGTLTLNAEWTSCTPFRRLAKYYDPYCNTSIWVPSDYIYASSYKANNFGSNVIGPDVCGNSLATININSLYESYSLYSCDPEIIAASSSTPVMNSISLSVYSLPSCTSASSITAFSGPSVLTYTFNNQLSTPINTSFTFFNNGIYTTTGTAYILATVVRNGCTSTFTLNATIKIKPSAIAGTITTNPCLSSTISITGDNPNATGYYWEYSYNSAFTPIAAISSGVLSTATVPASSFTAFPVYVRRVANGTTDCPNVAYSNTLTINNSTFTLTTSPSVTICAGSSATLTASGASTYTWMPGTITSSLTVVTPTANTVYTVTGQNSYGCVITKTVSVTIAPSPILSIASSTTSICQGSSATLTGSGASSYTWTAPAFSSTTNPINVTPSITTVYTLTGQNATGCVSIQTITITVVPGPSFEIGSSSTKICAKNSVTLTAVGFSGNTYTWTPGGMTGSTAVVTPTSSTVYTVTCFNGSGCTSTKTISVIVLPNPIIAVSGNTTICSGSTTTLTAIGATSYTWSALPSFTSTLNPVVVSPTVTTVGTVTGLDSYGCVGSTAFTITVVPTPTITVSGTTGICAGSTTTLTASGATSYTWLPSGSSINPSVISPSVTTTYTVIGSNGSCTATTQVVVDVYSTPILSITGNTTICSGSSTTLTAFGGASSFNWMPGSISGNPITVSPTTSTTYTVYGLGKMGCIGTATISVNVLPSPTVTITGNTNVCYGTTTTLTATGGGTYLWSPSGSTSPSITTGIAGVNSVTVTGSNGCQTVKTVTVVIVPLPIMSITPSSSTICAGASVTITSSGASLYSWSPGGMTTYTAVVSPSVTTVYTVTGTGTGKYGCSNTITATVNVIPTPTAGITGSSIICNNTPINLTATGGGSYFWNTGANVSVITVSTGGVYSVTVTSTNGCSSVASLTITSSASPTLTISPISPSICSGSSTTLTASGAFSYNWMPGGLTTNSIVVAPTVTTVYTVTGANKGGGCSSTKTVTVTVLPSPTVTISGSTSFCSGLSGTITATGGGTYLWNNGSTNSSIITNASINTVTVTGLNGCQTIKSVTLSILPTPTITIASSSSVICSGSCATLTAVNASTVGTAYTWTSLQSSSITVISTTSSVVVCPTVTTTYSLTGTTKGGCTSKTTGIITVIQNNPAFNIVNAHLSGLSYYTSTVTPVVTNANLVTGFGERYIIEEVNLSTGVGVPGTNTSMGTNPNPSCWWVYPTPLTFTGFNGTQNVATCPASGPYADGQFTAGKAYRITRGTWNSYCTWAQISTVVYEGAFGFVIANDNNAPDYSSLMTASSSKMQSNSNLNIYPNPSNGLMNIKLEGATESLYTVEIFDTEGKMIYKSSALQAKDSELFTELDIRKVIYKSGIYMLNLKSDNNIKSQRIIIE